jgi:hypothetical protein
MRPMPIAGTEGHLYEAALDLLFGVTLAGGATLGTLD